MRDPTTTDTNTRTYTARRKNYEDEREEGRRTPGKSGLILPLHCRFSAVRRDLGIKSYTSSNLILSLLSYISRCFPFTSLPLFLFPLYIPSARKALLCLGHEREGNSFCFALIRRHMRRDFSWLQRMYIAKRKQTCSSPWIKDFLYMLYKICLCAILSMTKTLHGSGSESKEMQVFFQNLKLEKRSREAQKFHK
jgi:hypothetical protein